MRSSLSTLLKISSLGSTLALLPNITLAYSVCSCTLSSDWDSQSYSANSGMRFDLRYDYINQSQLRGGTGTESHSDYPLPASRELERETDNRYLTIGVDYSPDKEWGVNVQVPYIYRRHSTWPAGETSLSFSETETLGDIRILGRYQGFSSAYDTGVQLGLKLPTGEFHEHFSRGTEAGELLDRGLQAGTGTTDLLVGIYHFGSLNHNWGYFTQALIEQPLNMREDYRQDTSLNLNAGVRYLADALWEPQVQLSAKTSGRDHGDNADSENSGGTILYLSPGMTVNLNKELKTYGFVQVPLYQKVNGLQLAPRYTASVGLHYTF